MKDRLIALFGLCVASAAPGAILLSDTFDAYTNGSLAGQGGWTVTAGDATDLVVNNGALSFVGTGADAVIQSPSFTSQTNVYYAFDLKVSAINTAGARPTFARLGTNRAILNIRDWNASTEFDLANNAGAQLSIDTTYRVIAHYVSNTSFTVWASTTPVESSPYYTTTSGGGGVTFLQLLIPDAAVLSATLDNLVVATTWAEAAAIPEPSTYALLFGMTCLGWVMLRHRRK